MRRSASVASNCDKLPFSKGKQTRNPVTSVSEFKNMHNTEDALQRQCDEYLALFPDVRVIRIPDTLWRIVNRLKDGFLQKTLGFCLGGMPDLVMIKKDGQYNSCFLVELKVKGRKQRQNQKKWVQAVNCLKIEFFEDFEREFLRWYNNA